MAACWGYGTHLPALRGCSLGFRATWQAILCLATGTGYSGGQRAGQAGAAVTWGRALVVATAESAATWQVTWGAVALTASSSTLMPATGLCIATAQLAPAHSHLLCCLEHLVFIETTWRPWYWTSCTHLMHEKDLILAVSMGECDGCGFAARI